MRLIYLASHFYPIMDASTRRIHSYLKSFASHGNEVIVLVFYPQATNNEGVVDGIKYRCITSLDYLKAGPLLRMFYRAKSIIRSGNDIIKMKPTALLTNSDSFSVNIWYALISKFLGVYYIVEKTEYPYGFHTLKSYQKTLVLKKLKIYSKVITISKELFAFYKRIGRPVFLLPMTIDPSIFDSIKRGERKPYIAVSFGVNLRDGLFDTIKVYERYLEIRGEKEKLALVLIGDFDRLCKLHPECKEILFYIKSKGLESHISFTGRITPEKVCELLANATCLVTTPTKYDSGGFPTKLGEYMLSGTPIVLTVAGEVNNYLKNNEHALISQPEDMCNVSFNISFIQDNPDFGEYLAENAKSLAQKAFNSDTYIDDLCEFIIN